MSRRWVGGGREPQPLAPSSEGKGEMRFVGVVVVAGELLTGIDKFGLLLSFFFFLFASGNSCENSSFIN